MTGRPVGTTMKAHTSIPYHINVEPRRITIDGITYIEHMISMDERWAAQQANTRVPETRYAMPGRKGAYRKGQIVDYLNQR